MYEYELEELERQIPEHLRGAYTTPPKEHASWSETAMALYQDLFHAGFNIEQVHTIACHAACNKHRDNPENVREATMEQVMLAKLNVELDNNKEEK